MTKRRMAILILILAPCTASIGSADMFTLASVEGTWTNVIGGGATVEFLNNQPVLYGNGLEDQVHWGTPKNAGNKSGLGFTGVVPPPMPFDAGDPFQIGQLRHFNYVVYAPVATALDLKINLNFSDPAGLSGDFVFTMNVDETPNSPINMPDYIYFPKIFSPETLVVGGNSYTLEILGFGNTPSNLMSKFKSPEEATNATLLWGRMTPTGPVVPAPSAAVLALIGMSMVGWLGRRRMP